MSDKYFLTADKATKQNILKIKAPFFNNENCIVFEITKELYDNNLLTFTIQEDNGAYSYTYESSTKELQTAKQQKISALMQNYYTAQTGTLQNGRTFYYQAFGDAFMAIERQYNNASVSPSQTSLIVVYDVITKEPYYSYFSKAEWDQMFVEVKETSGANMMNKDVAFAQINLSTNMTELNAVCITNFQQQKHVNTNKNFIKCNPNQILADLQAKYPNNIITIS